MSSLESVEFYEKTGYTLLGETGFLIKKPGLFAKMTWIPCKLLNKTLIPPTRAERFRTKIMEIASWLSFALVMAIVLVSIFL